MLQKKLKNSLCITLSAISIIPQISCFAKEETISKFNENKVKIDNSKLKELKDKLKNITLKEWLALASSLGISSVIALSIWKNKNSKNPSESYQPDAETLSKLNSVSTTYLTKEEIQNLEKALENEISDKNLEILKIDKTELDELIKYVLDPQNNIDEICKTLEYFYFSSNEGANIYDPQKRYVLSNIIYEASKLPGDNTHKNIYNKLFEVNEKINQIVILNALENQTSPIEARKTIANLLFLEHLGVLEFNYNKHEGEQIKFQTPEKEYTSSSLAYGETAIITLPYVAGNESFEEIFPGINTDKWYLRSSSHDFDFQSDENEVKVLEHKNGLIKNVLNCLLQKYQKGIDINITSKDKFILSDGSNGHILANVANGSLGSAALIKLESAAPKKTSVFGHNHGDFNNGFMDGAKGVLARSNVISATCQFRPFSPHSKRNGILVNLAGLTTSELSRAMDDFNQVFDKNATDTDFLKKLTGPKMNENELKQFLNFKDTCKETDSNKMKENNYIENAKKPSRFYENPENMKLISNSDQETGMMIFYNPKSNQYTYYISDQTKFRKFITNESERKQIEANQLTPIYLEPSNQLMQKDCTTISKISKQLETYIKNHIILNVNHLQNFEKSNPNNSAMLKNIKELTKQAQNDSYRIPGVKIYRCQGRYNQYTYYGYFIEDLEEFRKYCSGNGISEPEIKRIYACQNRWFYTSGNNTNNILYEESKKLLHRKFIKDLHKIKQYHALRDHKSSYVESAPAVSYFDYRIFFDDQYIKKLQEDSSELKLNGDIIFNYKDFDSINNILKIAELI